MKRSAYENEFQVRRYRDTKYSPELSKIAAALAEEAGVQWDPEEPELPARVWADGGYVVPEGGSYEETSFQEDVLLAREAAARYNAVTKIIQKVATPHSPHQLLREVLAAEVEKQREKPQCAKT